MPLHLETFAGGKWNEIGKLEPSQQPGSLSNLKEDGTREVLVFECDRNDRESTIFRSRAGVDIEKGVLREILSTHFDIVKTLKPGESMEINVRGPRMPQGAPIRFTHRTTEN